MEFTSSSHCKILQLLLNFLSCFHPLLLSLHGRRSDFFVSEVRLLSWLRAFPKFSVVLPVKVKTWSGLSGPTRLLASYLQLHLLSPYSPRAKLTHAPDVCGAANSHCCVLRSSIVFSLGAFFTLAHLFIQSDSLLCLKASSVSPPALTFSCFTMSTAVTISVVKCGHWQGVALWWSVLID